MDYVIKNFHWFVILIGALIFFHELGHFVVAKACRVKVLRFSLGFGPRLFGFVRGGTEYQVSALPFGGYVKMLGDVPGAAVAPEEQHLAFNNKPLWQRSLIVVAGPLFNFILAFLVYVFLATGTQVLPDTRIGHVSQGMPAWEAGLRPGDRIVRVNDEAINEWRELQQAISSRPGQSVRLTYERDGKQHTVRLSPKAHRQADVFDELRTQGRIGVSPTYLAPVIAIVDSDSPAAIAGVTTGDVVQKVNDVEVSAWHEVRKAVASTPAGEPVRLEVKRDERTLTLELQPAAWPEGLRDEMFTAADVMAANDIGDIGYTGLVNKDTLIEKVAAGSPAEQAGLQVGDRLLRLHIQRPDGKTGQRVITAWDIDLEAFQGMDATSEFTLYVQRDREVLPRTFTLKEREIRDELKNKRKVYEFGATHDASVAANSYTMTKQVGLFEGMREAALRTAADTTMVSKALAYLVSGRQSIDSMGGVIMMFVIAEKTANLGLNAFLTTMAMISVNLGLLNLLPIPVLDGGHLMFFGIEAVRRRPPSLRTREIAQVVGLAALLLLMVIIMTNDILKFIAG